MNILSKESPTQRLEYIQKQDRNPAFLFCLFDALLSRVMCAIPPPTSLKIYHDLLTFLPSKFDFTEANKVILPLLDL